MVQKFLYFFDRATLAAHMDYRVAIRTNRSEIGDWIDFVFLTDFR